MRFCLLVSLNTSFLLLCLIRRISDVVTHVALDRWPKENRGPKGEENKCPHWKGSNRPGYVQQNTDELCICGRPPRSSCLQERETFFVSACRPGYCSFRRSFAIESKGKAWLFTHIPVMTRVGGSSTLSKFSSEPWSDIPWFISIQCIFG